MVSNGADNDERASLATSGPFEEDRRYKRPVDKAVVIGDKYEIGEELGRGAYGQVFKGTDIRTGSVVAIKQISLAGMSAESMEDTTKEIDLLKNLNHKNIVKYIGSYKMKTHLYIFLEYMDQGALSQLIKSNRYGVLSEPIIAAYISQVLQGLQYLHAQGVVHRDIKGANILMASEGQVKLADFGVAARREAIADDFDPVGTPYWMAPEVIEMTGGTAAADIWSVGCVIIELLTGYPPYFELQPMSALYRIVQDQHPPLPAGISDALRAFLMRCFQKDPQDRPSAQDLLSDSWLSSSRSSLRSSWNKAAGFAHRSHKPRDAHETVHSVVRRILAAESSDGSVGEAALDSPRVSAAAAPEPPRRPSDEAVRRTADSVAAIRPDAGALRASAAAQRVSEAEAFANPLAAAEIVDSAISSGMSSPVPPDDRLRPTGLSVDGVKVVFTQNALAAHAQLDGAVSPPLQNQRGLGAGGRIPRPHTPPQITPERPDASSAGLPVVALANLDRPPRPPAPSAGGASATRATDAASEDHSRRGRGSPDNLDEPDSLQQGVYMHTPPTPTSAQPSFVTAGLAFGVTRGEGIEADGDEARRRQESGDVSRLVTVLHNVQQQHSVANIISACASLRALVEDKPSSKAYFLREAGVVALMELLQPPQDTALLEAALQLLLAVVARDTPLLESLCLVGVVPIVCALTGRAHKRSTRNIAAAFVAQLCRTSFHTVQMFVACGGVQVLVGMLETDFSVDSVLISAALESIWCVLQAHGSTPVNHFCRLFAKAGLVPQMLVSLKSMCTCAASLGAAHTLNHRPKMSHDTNAGQSALETVPSSHRPSQSWPTLDAARSAPALMQLLEQVCKLLLVLSYSDSVVKSHVCQPATLRQLLSVLQDLPSAPLLHKAVVSVKNLTCDPQVLPHMQEADAVALLVDVLRRGATKCNVAIGPAEKLEIVQALHNLCKMSKERQAQAAGAGVTPLLCQLVERSHRPGGTLHRKTAAPPPPPNEAETLSKTRNLCIRLLCALAHSNSKTRSELWACQGLDLFIDLLKEQGWRRQALDALATWLIEDTQRVEPKLLVKSNIQVVVEMLGSGGPQEALLELFDRMLHCSSKLSIAFGQSELPQILVLRLENADAFLSGHILDVIQSLYESHQRPKEFILRYDMKARLERVMKKHPSAVKVVNKCETLLRAIHVASVL